MVKRRAIGEGVDQEGRNSRDFFYLSDVSGRRNYTSRWPDLHENCTLNSRMEGNKKAAVDLGGVRAIASQEADLLNDFL